MIAVILIAFGLLVVALVIFAARGASAEVRSHEQLLGVTVAVDLAAFRNLVDQGEEEFLRTHLPAHEFEIVLRARERATLAYLKAVSHNAAVLLRLAETGRGSPDSAVANAAHELAQNAIQLRLYCLLLIVRLQAAVIFPAIPHTAHSIVERYQRFTDDAVHFVALGDPAFTSRMSAAL